MRSPSIRRGGDGKFGASGRGLDQDRRMAAASGVQPPAVLPVLGADYTLAVESGLVWKVGEIGADGGPVDVAQVPDVAVDAVLRGRESTGHGRLEFRVGLVDAGRDLLLDVAQRWLARYGDGDVAAGVGGGEPGDRAPAGVRVRVEVQQRVKPELLRMAGGSAPGRPGAARRRPGRRRCRR